MWVGLDSATSSILSFGTAIIYARLLEPDQFGEGTLAITIGQTIGVPAAVMFYEVIIQRDELSDHQRDAAAWASVLLGGVLAAICWIAAEPVARWFGQASMAPLIAWTAPSIFLTGLTTVFLAELQRHMRFRAFAVASISSRSAGALMGIGAALAGTGAWGLVVQQTATAFFGAAAVLAMSRRPPRLRISLAELKPLVAFMGANTVGTLVGYNVFRIFLIAAGSIMSTAALGHLSLAVRVLETARHILANGANAILLPVLSRQKNDPAEFRRRYAQASKLGTAMTTPVFIGIASCADEIVRVLFGTHWLEAVPAFQILAIATAIQCLFLFASVAVTAFGRPVWTIVQNGGPLLLAMVLLFLMRPIETADVALVWGSRVLILIPVGIAMVRLASGLSGLEQIRVIAAPMLAAALMGCVVALLGHLLGLQNPVERLLVLTSIGAVFYITALHLLAPRLIPQLRRMIDGFTSY
jgi:O-antigen/teichoic acid export membrane protein